MVIQILDSYLALHEIRNFLFNINMIYGNCKALNPISTTNSNSNSETYFVKLIVKDPKNLNFVNLTVETKRLIFEINKCSNSRFMLDFIEILVFSFNIDLIY